MSAYIEFQNAKKIYRVGGAEIQALTGMDFTIDKGESVITAGANGAGKSTVLDILGDVDSSTNGNIFVDGVEISRFNVKQLITYRRHDIGFVFQFYNLVQNLTIEGNVELATQTCKQPLGIDEAIEAVGLKGRISNFPAQPSGREQQRAAIICVLAKNSKLLLCDESIGALGYNTGKQILKFLQGICRQRGVSVVVITHNLALTAMGGKIIGMRNGKIGSITINKYPSSVERVEY